MTIKRILTLLSLLSIYVLSFGQQQFVRELNYEVNKDESTAEVREKAVNEIKRILLDELGSYIISEAKLEVSEDNSGVEEKYKSKTQSLSTSLMKTKILEEKRKSKTFYIKVTIEIDDKQLQEDLEAAGLDEGGAILIKVLEKLSENNVPSVSNLVFKEVTDLLNGLSVMEYFESGERIYNVSRNFNGQILNGDQILSGKFRIIYSGGSYTVFNLDNGYLTGGFERYDSNNNLVEKGEYNQSKREGQWKSYTVLRDEVFVSLKIEYSGGMKNGKVVHFKISGEVEKIRYFEDDIPVSEEIHESGGYVFKGNLDKYGKKDGEWLYVKDDITISKSNYKNGLKHGEITAYYISGQVRREGRYENDKPVGIHKEYYKNGQLEEEKEYDKEGKRIGNTYQYYENGEYKATYISDLAKGTKQVLKYYEDGTLRVEENYLLGDFQRKHGRQLRYYEDGTLREERYYDNNIQTGLSAEYFKDGDIRREINFIIIDNRTIKHGVRREYNSSKQLWKSENYEKGKYQGLQEYFSNGKKIKESEYNNGIQLWIKEYYYPNGNLKVHKEYPSGGKPSIEKSFYESGQLKSLAYNQAPKKEGGRYNKKTGEHKNYSNKGVLLNSTIYKNGKRDGLSLSYDTNGKLKSSQTYVVGKREGIYVLYFNGNLKETGEYRKGKRYGVWYRFPRADEVDEKTYDESGKILDSKKYNDASVKERILKQLD